MQEWINKGNADWDLLRDTEFESYDIELAGRGVYDLTLLLMLDHTRRSSWG
jgi:hypothetical protein